VIGGHNAGQNVRNNLENFQKEDFGLAKATNNQKGAPAPKINEKNVRILLEKLKMTFMSGGYFIYCLIFVSSFIK
jgi:hypothetical protein